MVMLNELVKNNTNVLLEKDLVKAELRPYLGMSMLGHPCERYLWYAFRWCFQEYFTPRQIRLFGRGHREEPVLIEALNKLGIRFYGEQDEVTSAFGHVKGHRDGACINVPEAPKTEHLAEFKTMADKYFKDLKKNGVKVGFPKYFAQMQVYMKHYKMTRALFVAVNKNTDEVHTERVRYDHEYANNLDKKAEEIILAEEPPERKFSDTWYECKWCAAQKICLGILPVEVNCRTCKSMDIYPAATWKCSLYDLELATAQQRKGCKKYECLEFLRCGGK